jgi:hypothetical protein
MKKNKTGTHIMLCIAPQVTDEYVKKNSSLHKKDKWYVNS